ncbi:hypothetical protein [Flavobacterium sp.]|jgi:hypothetical protein|uniref:hypothetical protein n=1 Tax=Flavobacterium sp. TaxID=239 RepID=UPI0037C02CAC
MKNYFTLVFLFSFTLHFAQNVGINTNTPAATLDINGNAMIKTVPNAAAAAHYDFMVSNPTTEEVQKLNGNFASATNTTITKAADTDGFSVLTLELAGGYQEIDFAPGTVSINPGNHFDASTDTYTVPSDGIYEIFYYFRFGTGIQASLLSTLPRIGILKTTGVTTTLLDNKAFTGVNLVVANLTITSSDINSVYALAAGDKISFGFNKGSLVSLGLLGSSRAEFVIKKISN